VAAVGEKWKFLTLSPPFGQLLSHAQFSELAQFPPQSAGIIIL
jgi:hypothetical protein